LDKWLLKTKKGKEAREDILDIEKEGTA